MRGERRCGCSEGGQRFERLKLIRFVCTLVCVSDWHWGEGETPVCSVIPVNLFFEAEQMWICICAGPRLRWRLATGFVEGAYLIKARSDAGRGADPGRHTGQKLRSKGVL